MRIEAQAAGAATELAGEFKGGECVGSAVNCPGIVENLASALDQPQGHLELDFPESVLTGVQSAILAVKATS